MISVLCPARGHPGWLAASAASLRATADGPVEFLVAVDDDDPETGAAAAAVADQVLVLPRAGYARLHAYYRALAAVAGGDWLMVWNDDITMLTAGWDTAIGALPPDVFVADVQSPHSPLCCVPAVRRSAVDAVGTFSSDNPHVDTFWQDLALAVGGLRAVPVHVALKSPVKAEHHGFYDGPHQAELAAYIAAFRAKEAR